MQDYQMIRSVIMHGRSHLCIWSLPNETKAVFVTGATKIMT